MPGGHRNNSYPKPTGRMVSGVGSGGKSGEWLKSPPVILLLFAFFLLTALVSRVSDASGSGIKKTGLEALTHARETGIDYHPTNFLVGYRPGPAISAQERAALHAGTGVQRLHSYRHINADLVELLPGQTLERAFEAFSARPEVKYVEPNYVVRILDEPNDPRFEDQWALNNTGQTGGTPGADIDALGAWNITTGSRDVIVAIIDTGIDYTHDDIADNMWVNPDPHPVHNDLHGAEWTGGQGNMTSGDPMDGHGHGTHVAGTVGAVGNNEIGVTGVNWKISLMALRFMNDDGKGTTADAIAAIEYAIDKGAHLTNNSWGAESYNQSLKDVIEEAADAGQLFVAAAGNQGKNNDETPTYPASYDLPNIISVASSDHNDALSSFSNYGAGSVHLAAPGSSIFNTIPDSKYDRKSGTSMAAPHVAGAAALVLADDPSVSYEDIKQRIMDTVTPVDEWDELLISGGRLNAAKALAPDVDTVTISPEEAQTITAGQTLKFEAEARDQYENLIADEGGDFTWQNAGESGLFDNTEAGTYQVSASYGDVTSPPVSVTVEPAGAERFIFSPTGSQTAGEPFEIDVWAVDEYGNVVTDYEGAAGLSDSTGTLDTDEIRLEEGKWSGEVVITGAYDQVIITAVELDNGALEGDSAPFEVLAAPASALAFTGQPTRSQTLVSMDPSVIVQLLDEFGNEAGEEGVEIELTLSGGEEGARLSGNETETGPGGMAEFTDLRVDHRGADYVLTAASHLVEDAPPATAESMPFDVFDIYTLTVDIDGAGVIEVDGDPYSEPMDFSVVEDEDGMVRLEAIAAEGWAFDEWEDGTGDSLRDIAMLDGDFLAKARFITYIQSRIDEAVPGDVIELGPDNYTAAEPILIGEGAEGITLRSTDGRDATFIDAGCGEVVIVIETDDITIEGFWIGGFSQAGIVIRGNNARIADNVIDGYCEESKARTGTGILMDAAADAAVHDNRIKDAQTGVVVRGTADRNRIMNNIITRSKGAGIENLSVNGSLPTDTLAFHNNILDNKFGVDWVGEEGKPAHKLRATYNWWGHESGPLHESNPGGEGDEVLGEAYELEFYPWIDSKSKGIGSGAAARQDEPGEDKRYGLRVRVETEGDGNENVEVFASRLLENATGVPFKEDTSAVYTKIFINPDDRDAGRIKEIIYEIGYNEPSDKVAFWFDKGQEEWVEGSHQRLEPDPIVLERFTSYGFDGYLEVSIRPEGDLDPTSPHLGHFSGIVFAVGAEERSGGGGGGGGGDCFIATAAYGTPMVAEIDALRALRDQKLLTTDAGRSAVGAYYRLSPPVAGLIGRSDTARAIVREALRPVVSFSRDITQENEE